MAVIPNNPKVVKVTLVYNRTGRIFINTFHVQRTATWTAVDMANLGNAFRAWFTNFYSGAISSAVSLVSIQLRLYNPALPLAVDQSIVPPISGSVAGAPEAANVTLSMSERTGLAGRAFRGRFYVPGFGQSQCTSLDLLDSTSLGILSAAAGQLLVIGTSTGSNLTIWHRLLNTFTDVTSMIIDSTLDSQRRRLPGRGR